MSHSGARPRQPVQPPVSSRTLHHPSFLPLYMVAGFGHQHRDCNSQTVHPIIPEEFFYTDPTMGCGRRIANITSDLRVFDWFQLNTPPPVMSPCPAPPVCPDPFRSGPHPTRTLGSPTLRTHTHCHQVPPTQVVITVTQEEDQAVTNLLELHHQNAETLTATQIDFPTAVELKSSLSHSHQTPMDSTSAEELRKTMCSDVQCPVEVQQERGWSDTELEAANTLLSHFSLKEVNRIHSQNHHNSAETLPDPLPCLDHEDSSVSTETQYDALRAGVEHRVVPGETGERVLSNSEGDAVDVLLSLGNMVTLDIVQ